MFNNKKFEWQILDKFSLQSLSKYFLKNYHDFF
jgi:hypothetical protein